VCLAVFFFACVAMIVIGLVTGETRWFLAVAILMAAAVVGRLVGLVGDGLEAAALPPLIVELVIGGAMLAAHYVLT
jgi:hypothetical protein